MARNKLTDLQKKKIIADYVENQNYSETARMNNTTDTTVRTLVEKDKSTLEKIEQKKEQNTITTLEYMEKQHETKKRIIDKLLKAIEDKADNIDFLTNIKDLATAYGILLDKELKVLELKQKNETNNEDLQKVKEILVTIKEAAEDDRE